MSSDENRTAPDHGRSEETLTDEVLAELDDAVSRPVSPAAEQSRGESADRHRQAAELLAGFPEAEQDAARRGMYLDADGVLRTRHRSLRSL